MTARPAGSEAFAKCPTEGCFVHVWGVIWGDNYCREHGGTPAIQTHEDEYGLPVSESGPDLLHRAAPRPLEAS